MKHKRSSHRKRDSKGRFKGGNFIRKGLDKLGEWVWWNIHPGGRMIRHWQGLREKRKH